MSTTCYSKASQQPLNQAQTHIPWSSECVGGQTPFHLVTARMSPFVCEFQYFLLRKKMNVIRIHEHYVSNDMCICPKLFGTSCSWVQYALEMRILSE